MERQRVYGLDNETKIITYLNEKKFSELNDKWKAVIIRMFPFVKENDLIHAKHFPDYTAKPDMTIQIRHSFVHVSIKTGKNPSVHQESFYSFERFLDKLKVSKRTQEIIRFFHFGDSRKLKTNGKPICLKEMKEKYSSYFLEASKELDNTKIIEKVIDRTVIRGTSSKRTGLDYLYYGDLEHGKLLSVEDIYSMVLAYREHGKSAIHFGGLNYNPSARSTARRERGYVRIKWPLLSFLYYRSEEDVEKMKEGLFVSSDVKRDK